MNISRHLWVAAVAALGLVPALPAGAASHREAPLVANDPAADITDTYFFRSWQSPGNVVLIMNVIPAQEPSAGPNYYNFGDDVLYSFHVDVNGDGNADDVVYEVRFKTELRGPLTALKLPVAQAGGINGVIPSITALDGAGAEGLMMRQSYTVTEVRNGVRTNLGTAPLYAVPSNMGAKTMPDYEGLAAKGIFGLSNGGKVFAGQRDETFYIDLGATFDTINLRRAPPVLSPAEDASDSTQPFGKDHFAGFNVSTIAIEVPITALTSNPNAVLGLYASTSRQKFKIYNQATRPVDSGPWVQIARLANPLVNEVIIGTQSKDLWNTTDPKQEALFKDFYLISGLGTVLNLVYDLPSLGLAIPTAGRTDLLNVLLKYPTQPQTGTCNSTSPCSELLRLNLAVAPTAPDAQKRLTVLAGDNAGWPNGRRPNDDVTDVALRVVAGKLVGSAAGNLALGDGVNCNAGAPGTNLTANGIYKVFPYLPTPHDGRDRNHTSTNCGLIAQ